MAFASSSLAVSSLKHGRNKGAQPTSSLARRVLTWQARKSQGSNAGSQRGRRSRAPIASTTSNHEVTEGESYDAIFREVRPRSAGTGNGRGDGKAGCPRRP